MSVSIVVTDKIKRALNKFAGIDLLPASSVGKEFTSGEKEGDGEIGISIQDGYKCAEMNYQKFISSDGSITKRCYRQNQTMGSAYRNGMLTYFPTACPKSFSIEIDLSCDGTIKNEDMIEPEKAKIIIGALFGFEELSSNYIPRQSEIDAVANLRREMGLIFGPTAP